MSVTKEFHIGDILSVTSGVLVSPRHVDGIYDLLGWMTDGPVWTHQLPRVADECAPSLRQQFPDLAALEVPEGMGSEEAVLAWLAGQESVHGSTREVEQLAPDDHTSISPIRELKMMRPDAPIIAVGLEEE